MRILISLIIVNKSIEESDHEIKCADTHQNIHWKD